MKAKAQNTSPAVMAQRKEPRQSLDDFPTPPWATRALVEHVLKPAGLYDPGDTVWEPAANRGFMVRALREYYNEVYGSDIKDYGAGFPVLDFVAPLMQWELHPPMWEEPDLVITNPPFTLASEFIKRGLEVANKLVCIFGRIQLLEGKGRWKAVNKKNLLICAPFVERVALVKGRIDKSATSATMYAWFVYSAGPSVNPSLRPIPPCRHELERDGDYEEVRDGREE